MKPDLLHRIFNPTIFKDDYKGVVGRFLNAILMTITAIISLLLLYRLITGGSLRYVPEQILLFIVFVCVMLLFINRRGYVTQGGIALVTLTWLAMTYQAWKADGIYDVAVATYIIIILMTSVLINWRAAAIATLASIVVVWWMAFGHFNSVPVPHTDTPQGLARDLTVIFLLAGFLIFYLVRTLEAAMARTRREFEERIRAEQALREKDERFRRIFNISPVAISVTSLVEGRLLEANDAYWRLTGFDPHTCIGRTTLELKIWKSEADRQKFVKKMIERRSLRNPSYEFFNENGERRITSAFYELIDQGGGSAVLSVFYDVTDQQKAQAALSQSEARTNALLNAIPDMIFELRRDGTILHFIPSVSNQPLLPPEEFIGKTIRDVIPTVADQAAFTIDRALESGQLNAFEYQMGIGDEIKTFEARITPVGPDLVLAMVRDVSLRHWAESERERLIDELEAKNAELERFTYTVSHDLKSPLITIKGFLGFIREDTAQGNLQRLETDIRRISDAADKMQRLLGDLLELSRIGRLTNKPELVETNNLVREVLDYLHGRIHAANATVQVEEALPLIFGDRQRIFEVFQNLIDNSAKFMGDQPNPCIEIGQRGEADGKPVFYVRDNGLGIAHEYKDRIFGLFNKLDAQTEGTGIGLTLVKRIIEFHGGRIWVDSSPGGGATFFFTLPSQPVPER